MNQRIALSEDEFFATMQKEVDGGDTSWLYPSAQFDRWKRWVDSGGLARFHERFCIGSSCPVQIAA